MLAWNILNVPNTRMGRPPDQELKNMLKHIVSKSHSIMGEISLCALQVSIEKSTNITFGGTLAKRSPNIIHTANSNK